MLFFLTIHTSSTSFIFASLGLISTPCWHSWQNWQVLELQCNSVENLAARSGKATAAFTATSSSFLRQNWDGRRKRQCDFKNAFAFFISWDYAGTSQLPVWLFSKSGLPLPSDFYPCFYGSLFLTRSDVSCHPTNSSTDVTDAKRSPMQKD